MVNKKKRNQPDLKEILARPWCYYCERDFDDLKVLVAHQKAKHFKCDHCNRRLNTSGGLQVHLQQVHKATLTVVENAIDGRQNIEPEIFGMTGIPEELVKAHEQRVENEYNKQQADHRALTGNPPPGQHNGQPNSKKRKIETVEEMKARAAEHKAKRAAERQAQKEGKAAQTSSSNTPDPTTQAKPTPSASDFMAPLPQTPYDHSYYDQPQQIPLFAPYSAVPMQAAHAAGFPPSFPGQQPGQWSSRMPPTSFSPPQAAPYATPSFMPPARSQATAQMPSVATHSHISAPPNIARSPAVLQPALGLPARPSFDPPSFNREDMQRMHTGQAPPSVNTAGHTRPAAKPHKLSYQEQEFEDVETMVRNVKNEYNEKQAKLAASNAVQEAANDAANPASDAQTGSANATQEAANEATTPAANAQAGPANAPAPPAAPPNGSRQKRPFSLVYDHHDESPEQKMAKWSKYN
ncbi:hypothetical protein MBLNU13_g01524t1 [Cladosporium sp. NU13]